MGFTRCFGHRLLLFQWNHLFYNNGGEDVEEDDLLTESLLLNNNNDEDGNHPHAPPLECFGNSFYNDKNNDSNAIPSTDNQSKEKARSFAPIKDQSNNNNKND